MPVPPTCPFHQHARSTNMPVPPTCPFHQHARSTNMPVPPTRLNNFSRYAFRIKN
ncbi:MAG: hypothetical protein F6K26_27150 [Moorea sp. SIO2I5]|nr:hypothetical protein [Moorena sp. SIO2I5]